MITEDKITEIFCVADDFCKEFNAEIEKHALGTEDGKVRRKRSARMSEAEIITIIITFHFNSFRNFKHYYLYCVCGHWKLLFPQTVSYNRFVELMPRCFVALVMFLKLACFGQCTGISFVDSTCIPVIHNKRERSMRVFKDVATKGKSTMGWFIGFKLHLLCNEKGEILNFVFTKANVDDRQADVMNALTDKVFGKLYADRGYISHTLFGRLWDKGVHIVTGIKSNMKNRLMPVYDKIMLRKRSVIDTVNDMLKNVAQLVHTRHRSVHNFIMNVLAAIGAYCFFVNKPGVNFDFALPEPNGQLTLFE
ncbi:MAG: IS982 family transposase [Muribaculaceae bacterium]|nr:IS982 family transposase [Muribaculaceae bacterium]